MAIIIQQEHAAAIQSLELIAYTSIRSVRLVEAHVQGPKRHWETADDVVLDSEISFSPADATVIEGSAGESGSLMLVVEFTFRAFQKAQAGVQDILIIRCRFESSYALKPGHSPTSTQISAFHGSNAVFNCWPFFREFVQSMAVRIEFPPPPVPFLVVTSRSEPRQGSTQLPDVEKPKRKTRSRRAK